MNVAKNIPYSNLKAEMARRGVKQIEIAEFLNVREATISDKINGKSTFDIDEAFKIKLAFFPDLSLDYLFSREITISA